MAPLGRRPRKSRVCCRTMPQRSTDYENHCMLYCGVPALRPAKRGLDFWAHARKRHTSSLSGDGPTIPKRCYAPPDRAQPLEAKNAACGDARERRERAHFGGVGLDLKSNKGGTLAAGRAAGCLQAAGCAVGSRSLPPATRWTRASVTVSHRVGSSEICPFGANNWGGRLGDARGIKSRDLLHPARGCLGPPRSGPTRFLGAPGDALQILGFTETAPSNSM